MARAVRDHTTGTSRICRTPQCRRSQEAQVRVMRRLAFSCVTLMLIASIVVPAASKDRPKAYQKGRLLDMTVEDVSRGTATIGGMSAPIPGRRYIFKIQLDDVVYFAEYNAGKLGYKPDWIVNDPIEVRFEKDKMFLKRSDGKELEVAVIKKERQD
jgi:hypothetical protein